MKTLQVQYDKIQKINVDYYAIFLGILLLVGAFIRLYALGEYPLGLHQDEAFSGYEAFCMLEYGTDSFGYVNPSYLTVWGSGMSVLQSRVAMLFFQFFGANIVTLRLGQALLSSISLVAFYSLLRELETNRWFALLGLFLLVISPWHIEAARWALDANYAIYFLLFALLFFVKGIKDNRYWFLCAFFYGISLYAYILMVAVVPLTLLGFGLYLLFSKTRWNWKIVLGCGVVLGAMALPQMFFLLVNYNVIPEIKTAFFSVPKLISMRSGEINLHNLLIGANCKGIARILLNTVDKYAVFYCISAPFFVIGLGCALWKVVQDIKCKSYSVTAIMLIGFLMTLVVAMMVTNVNVYKMNGSHLYSAFFITLGLYRILQFLGKRWCSISVVAVYLVCFAFFLRCYVTSYNQTCSIYHNDGVYQAVEYINEHELEDVQIDEGVFYPQVLFADKTPVQAYRDTVEYVNYPSPFLRVVTFTKYTFGIDYNELTAKTYLVNRGQMQVFLDAGYAIVPFGNYIVATAPS